MDVKKMTVDFEKIFRCNLLFDEINLARIYISVENT